jgi:hypothetical protein
MSEQTTLLSDDAPRAAVIRQLGAWSRRRAPGFGDPPGGRQEEPLLAAIAEGSPGSWDGLCETIHSRGLHLDMLATAPGLWSHCRLAAGPAWNGVATMTRGLMRHLDNALVAGRPLVASIPSREEGAGGTAWTYALTVDPLSIAAGDALTVGVQSPDAALAAATIVPASGNQFLVTVPALDAAGGPLQTLTLIVTDLSTHQSDVQLILLVVGPPGGTT